LVGAVGDAHAAGQVDVADVGTGGLLHTDCQLGESEEGFQVMDKPGDAKYGMTEEQMIDGYKKLMAKGAKNFGIHAFLASNTISDAYYPELAGILFQLAV
ncbi:diaminopimelate decarboxylase, partial [Faecalibacterium sp. DFI.5.82]|nr:diaminopimelate decarboxylase [Faecalibacterium sp. DFI.5.82]